MVAATHLYRSDLAERPALRSIRRLSAPFEWAFLLLAVLLCALASAVFFFALAPGIAEIWIGPTNAWLVIGRDTPPPGAVALRTLAPATQIVAGGAFALIAGAAVSAMFFLRSLFACYRSGDVFGDAPQAWMRRAALALIAFAAGPVLLQPMLRAVGSPDRGWLQGHTIPVFLIGAALLVFARVIALGRELEHESKGFV